MLITKGVQDMEKNDEMGIITIKLEKTTITTGIKSSARFEKV